MKLRTKTVLIAALTLVPAFALAWTGPTQAPPNGNVSAPINTSASGQVKSGDFAILGNFGAGTPAPGTRIDVNGNINVRATWDSQALQINGNQIWKSGSGPDATLYLQWSLPGGNVMIGGQGGATNSLTVQGNITARDRITSPQYCIGASCITSWASGSLTGSGTTNYIPRFTAGTTLGNSSITSDGVSATSNGNFFAPMIYDSSNSAFYLNPDSLSHMRNVNISYDGTGECCSGNGNFTLSLAEATNVTGRRPSIQFHSGGVSEGYLRLVGNEFTFAGNQQPMTARASGYVRGDQGLCIGADCRTSWAGTVGPQGPAGATGATGPAGPQGPTGPAGFAGSGTAGYIPRLTAATTIGNSSITSDGSSATSLGALYINEWARVNGTGGIYWQNWGGGWHMTDTTWVRSYNNKSIYTGGQVRADGGLCMGASCRTTWPSTTFGGAYAYGAAVCPGIAAGIWEQVQCQYIGEGGTICSTVILGMYCRDVYIN